MALDEAMSFLGEHTDDQLSALTARNRPRTSCASGSPTITTERFSRSTSPSSSCTELGPGWLR